MKATTLAMEHLMCAVGDPLADLRNITPDDPGYARAQLIRAATGIIAKSPAAFPAIADAIRSLEGLSPTKQTRAHISAAEAWISGNPVLAAKSYASIVVQWPRDVLALRLAQSCYFYLGRHDRLCAIVDAILPAWQQDWRGYGHVLAIASYAHAENGEAAHAEMLGRQALAIDAACPLGVHSVAHAMAEAGRPADGARWMRDQAAHWASESRMRTHNAWHLGMFDADEGDLPSALAILDRWLLPASADCALDACDATALLWRLTPYGLDDPARWSRLSDAFEATVDPGFWPFVDLHAAFAHLNAGRVARAHSLSRQIDRCAAGFDYAALRARHITQPGLRALNAWAACRYAEAANRLRDLRPVLSEMGGSHVQLEIFASIEREASRRQHHDLRLKAA